MLGYLKALIRSEMKKPPGSLFDFVAMTLSCACTASAYTHYGNRLSHRNQQLVLSVLYFAPSVFMVAATTARRLRGLKEAASLCLFPLALVVLHLAAPPILSVSVSVSSKMSELFEIDDDMFADGEATEEAVIIPAVNALRLPEMPDEPAAKEEEKECIVCLDRAAKVVLAPCGHSCFCVTCTRVFTQQAKGVPRTDDFGASIKCPVCKTQITGCIRMFA
jgi:hypothetical protein